MHPTSPDDQRAAVTTDALDLTRTIDNPSNRARVLQLVLGLMQPEHPDSWLVPHRKLFQGLSLAGRVQLASRLAAELAAIGQFGGDVAIRDAYQGLFDSETRWP